MILRMIFAVCPTTEKTLGMALLMASEKSLLFMNFSICPWFSCIQSLMSAVRLLVSSSLVQPFCQHIAQFVKLVNHM